MKRIISFFIAAVFIFSTLGLQFTIHQCMGKGSLIIYELTINKDCKCPHGSSSHKSSCCNDNIYTFEKNDTPFTNSSKQISVQNVSFHIFYHAVLILTPFISETNLFPIAVAHAPPETGITRNILFCTFRI